MEPTPPSSPPPVTPDTVRAVPAYEPTLLDRLGPEGALVMRARVVSVLTFVITFPLVSAAAALRPATAAHPLLAGFVGASLAAALVHFMLSTLPAGAGAVALAVTFPKGETTPYEEQFSLEESFAARGDIPAALAAFEAIIAERPGAAAPRMRAAELYAGRGNDPRRAAELFREIRAIPDVSGRDALYACSRLVDLYDGVLNDPGRALVELRRIIELYPGSPAARFARDALPRLKARLPAAGR